MTGSWKGAGAADFVAPEPGKLGVHLPHVEVLELLGRGGMGAVYKARQTKLDRLVALKILPPEAGRDPAFAERFVREARALARLSHPNIVAIHDFGDAGELHYLIMDYVDGVSLRQLLHTGPLPPQEALRIVAQICEALQYAHDEGVVHRDIKPENILLDKKGRVKIADFGLAKLVGATAPEALLTGSRQVMGTPHYMAPEQLERPQTVDHRADIYALGVVFYEMLTGELPLGRFAVPSARIPVDVRVDEIVLRALEKEPERRYQRVSEVKTEMELIGQFLPPTTEPATSAPVLTYQEELDFEMCRLQVLGPAAGLILTGVLAFAQWAVVWGVAFADHWHYVNHRELLWDAGLTALGIGPFVIVASLILVFGGRRMMRLERYGFVVLASICAMIPWSLAFLVGLPIGIWALRVLRRRDVKWAFVRKTVRSRRSAVATLPSPQSTPGLVHAWFQALRSLMFVSRVQTQPSAPQAITEARVENPQPTT
jgi:tRNA A-37 threonylcarbamoyl transferase component Bud32